MMHTAATNGPEKIVSHCVKHVPHIFPGNMKENMEKACRWLNMRETTMQLKTVSGSLTLSSRRKRLSKKELSRYGRKQSHWVTALDSDLLEEFYRLRAAGVLFSSHFLLLEAREMVQKIEEGSLYHHSWRLYAVPTTKSKRYVVSSILCRLI